MMNNRMNALVNAGIDTDKFFTVAIDKNLPKGTTFKITIGEDGFPTLSKKEVEEVVSKIKETGYINNYSLFRRWVMAQTFRMLNDKEGYNKALKRKPYSYQWTMLENELDAMRKIQKEDPARFEIRKDFFTREVIIAMFRDYQAKVREKLSYVWGYYTTRYHNGCSQIDAVIYSLSTRPADDYEYFYEAVRIFNRHVKERHVTSDVSFYKLPDDTEKCKEWISAYKGAGAYYTLENMFKFHNCRVYICNGKYKISLTDSLITLEEERKEHKKEWYKLFGWMREVIADNHFDFNEAMAKQYNRK